MITNIHSRTLTLALTTLLMAFPAWSQEAEEESAEGWSDVAELSYVVTGGNSESSTLSFRNTLARSWKDATFTLESGALRAESTTASRFAVGTPDSFQLRETTQTEVTAESYHLRGRYEHTISQRLYWFTGGGWDRNEPAGIQDRFSVVGGVGQLWFDDADSHFQTDYGVTYTSQTDVVDNPTSSDEFLGVRLGWNYRRKLGETTSYTNLLTLDANADDTSDYRADMTNSVAVSMSERLALKVSLQLLYDNVPSLKAAPLRTVDGQPTGLTVLAPVDDLDTYFTVALVVNF